MNSLIKKCVLKCLSCIGTADTRQVMYYHDVGLSYTAMGTPFEVFRLHVDYTTSHGYCLFSDVEALKSDGRRGVVVCFDDGYRGIWDYRKFFIEKQLFPTVFLAVDLIGRPDYLGWDEILELQRNGFRFQSHTWSHRSLTDVPYEELAHELRDSRNYLAERLGRDVSQLCFPRGLFSARVLEACAKAEYEQLFTSVPGLAGCPLHVDGDVPDSVELIPRVLAQSADVSEYRSLLRGAMSFFAGHYVARHFRRNDV